tara:strand:+ start:588 stop:1178 length:591 start_codon:yes stop_codon:yes gene_type:complete
MISVYCVNWGTKYPREFVDTLKASVQEHLTVPHKFICYTDNPVEEYDIPVKYPYLRGVWHKLALLENHGDSLFFDLDIKINSNIDFLCEDFDKFSVLDSAPWKGQKDDAVFRMTQNTMVNSSVMRWSDHAHIFEKFQQHRDMYLRLYSGIDRFIYNEEVDYHYIQTNKITSWLQNLDNSAIVLYNGKYNEIQSANN